MRFHKLDLNLLVALDALLTERGVTRAGLRIHLSQSAMSCALDRLRAHLGDHLLVKSGRGMVLTEYGESLAPRVRALLAEVDATFSAPPQFDPLMSSRHFVVAASDYAIAVLLLDVQRRFENLAPHASIEILPVQDATTLSLRRGEVDLVIVPDAYRFDACAGRPLFEDRFVCVAAETNHAIGETIVLTQYAAAEHVAYRPDTGHTIASDTWLREHHAIAPTVKVSLPSYALLPRAVAGTNRIATMPRRLAEIFRRSERLRIVEPAFAMPVLRETLQWQDARAGDAGVAWLRSLIVAMAGSIGTSRPPARVRPARARPGGSPVPLRRRASRAPSRSDNAHPGRGPRPTSR